MEERRAHPRETTLERTIQARAVPPNGTTLNGLLLDMSPSGVLISGNTTGLVASDEISLTLFLPLGKELQHRFAVRHIGPERRCWDAEFAA